MQRISSRNIEDGKHADAFSRAEKNKTVELNE